MRCNSAVHRACLEPARAWRGLYANNGIRSSIRRATAHLPTQFARDLAKSFSTTPYCLAYKAALSISTLGKETSSGSLSDRKAANSLIKDAILFPRPLTDPQGPVAKALRRRQDGLLEIWAKKGHFSGPLTAMLHRRTPRDYVDKFWLNDGGEFGQIRRLRDKLFEASDTVSRELIRLAEVIKAGITDGTLSFLFRTIGNVMLHDPDVRWRQYGLFTMECAAELGEIEAALILCHRSNKTVNYTPPTAALEVLQEVCNDGVMWQALIIRAQQLSRQPNVASKPAVLEEALALARKAVELTEPSNSQPSADDGYGMDPPWHVLWEIAIRLGDQASVLDAVKEGAMKYNDPEACDMLAEATTVTTYSAQWLELTTKAAMNGSNSASYALGKYWLEKTGWYPCSGNAPNSSDTNIGFDWLELAASKRSPQPAAVVYLTIGLVCHENGRTKLGKQYLEAGVEAIANNPQSAQSPGEATKAVEYLRTTITDWDSQMRPGTGVSWHFFHSNKAAQYLMAPRMPLSEQTNKST